MIDSITRITLNLQETNTMVSIRAKRGDTGRKLLIHLSDGSIPYHISDDCYATFTAKKPDGTKINNACTIENNVIEYEFTEQTCTAVGTMKAEIRLYGADAKMITSACFLVNVYDTVFRDGDEVGSETEMNTLDDLILRANAFLNETGKLLRWQGNWNSETEYEANDLVLHEEVLYVAEEAIAAGTVPGSEGAVWVPIAGMGTGSGGEVVGIASVKQTTTTSTSGGVNVVTVTLTDGTESEIKIRNGQNGMSIQGPTGPQGPRGPAGASIMGPVGPMGPRGLDGDDGGHYVPAVTQPDDNTLEFSFTPSKSDMPAVEPVQVELPAGQGNGGNANQGTGLTSTEKNLMLALFKAVPYISDVSATMKSLEAIWAGSSSGGETPDIPDVTNYTVTYNLTSVTADSTPASVIEGGSLTVNLTPGTNAVLDEVVVTMGGVDVTATAYSNGKISISSVTGNVVITATATVASYTQVEYLEANNDTSSGIVTDYVPSNTDLVEGEFSCVAGAQWAYLFAWNNRNSTRMLISRFDNMAGRTLFACMPGYSFGGTKNDPDPSFSMPSNTNGVWRFAQSEPGSCTIYDADGNEQVTLTDALASTCVEPCAAVSVGCFSTNGGMRVNTGAANLRIHSFRIKNAYGDTMLDLIPVLDADNAPCMYDKISGKYYYCPNGNEYFTAGGAV